MQPSKHKSCKMYVSVDAQNSWGVGRCTRLALQTAWGAGNGLSCRPICSFSQCLWLTIDRSQDDMLVKCRERALSCLVFAGPFQSTRCHCSARGSPALLQALQELPASWTGRLASCPLCIPWESRCGPVGANSRGQRANERRSLRLTSLSGQTDSSSASQEWEWLREERLPANGRGPHAQGLREPSHARPATCTYAPPGPRGNSDGQKPPVCFLQAG